MAVSSGFLRNRQAGAEPSLQDAPGAGQTLRLLSFNVQVGIRTTAYHQYLTRCWKHLLPHRERAANLDRTSQLLQEFDIVALQEVDGGSLRTNRQNQVRQLASQAGFPYWYQQLNRNLAPFAQHSNGLLSRFSPSLIEDHALPGPKGRGAILVRYGDDLAIIMMHLALGSRIRNLQLGYICELASEYRHCVLMGDMNTHIDDLLYRSPLRDLELNAAQTAATFPSWKPARCLDHILLSPGLEARHSRVVSCPLSDHLPVATEIRLPDSF